MKQLLLLLFLSACTIAKSHESFHYDFKNAIQIHPFFPAGIPFDYYLAELDYLRQLKQNKSGHVSILARLRVKQDNTLYYEPVANDGKITSAELEAAIRQTFIWAQGTKAQFGGYLQIANSHGIQQYYVEYRHKVGSDYNTSYWVTDSTETQKGYIGTVSISPGLTLQIRRVVISNDIAVGVRLNPLEMEDSDVTLWFKPNFTIGFLF